MTKKEELKDYIVAGLVKRFSESDRKNIERYLNRSLSVILHDLLPIAASDIRHDMYKHDEDVKLLAATQFRKSWKQITINSIQTDSPTLLLPILFQVASRGTTGIGSAVRFKEITLDALMEYAIEQCNDTSIATPVLNINANNGFFQTPIDVATLREFANKVASDTNIDRKKKLKQIQKAHAILTSLQAVSDQSTASEQKVSHVLNQEILIAASGRCYFKGLNLQNCPKDVRHAALGHCHQYDMRAGVFGVMGGIAKAYCKQLGNDVEFHHIKHYIKYKEEIRIKITKLLWPEETKSFTASSDYKSFHGFYKVKQALTAIGFGAKQSGNAAWQDVNGKWQATSLSKTFKDRATVDKFLQIEVVKQLMAEFKTVTKIVLLQLKDDPVFASKFAIEGLKDGQKLAMVYQGTEAMILAELLSHIHEYGILLPAHDGVYVRQRFDLASVLFKMQLPFGIDKSYVQFDHAQIGLATPADHESSHKRNIAEQERKASGYVPVHSNVSATPFVAPKQQVMTPWGLIDANLMMAEDKLKH